MSGLMRLSLLQEEYGGDYPISLSEYYVNNQYVNSSSYIPEEGNTLSFSHFMSDLGITLPHTCLTANNGFNLNLNAIDDWFHNENNILPIIQNNLTNFYFYEFDGSANANSVNYINDGGGDMFDSGNYIDISGNCITGFSNLSYGSKYTEPTHGFYITPTDIWPNTTVAYVQTGTVRINVHGNRGSDGDATITNDYMQYTTCNDLYGDIYYNASGDAGDPSILDVWFTIQNSNWNSIITSSNDQRETEDDNLYSHSVEVGGSNYIFVKTLLSLSDGQMPSSQYVVNYVSSFVENLPLFITASNVNEDNRLPYGDQGSPE